MLPPKLLRIACCVLALWGSARATAGEPTRLSTIPRVDVRAHLGGDPSLMERYLEIGRALKDEYDANLDIWIDLGSYRQPKRLTVADFDEVKERYQGRFLTCLDDYLIADGLQYTPEEIEQWQARGAVGYKIWIGVSPLSRVAHFAERDGFCGAESQRGLWPGLIPGAGFDSRRGGVSDRSMRGLGQNCLGVGQRRWFCAIQTFSAVSNRRVSEQFQLVRRPCIFRE